MSSSCFPAVGHGNRHVRSSKERATMHRRGPFFLMTAADDGRLFHSAVEGTGEWVPGTGADALPNFTALREMFSFPILGRKPAGRWAMSSFGWDFGEATVRPVSCWLSIDAPLVPGVEPRICLGVASGAFEVRGMLWQLGWPSTD